MGSEKSALPLCTKGCEFFGSVENKNMCSKCYANFLKENLIANGFMKLTISGNEVVSAERTPAAAAATTVHVSGIGGEGIVKNRCEEKECNKKVGLMGFKCKCGKIFCRFHRFPKEHSCSFDFKTFDRKILATQNPIIKRDKLDFRV